MPLKRTSLVIALAALATVLVAAAPARADVKGECVNASTKGQSLRDGAKLRDAREQFVQCARDACPAIVKKACADWLAEVDARLPTVVFRAQLADGSDAVGARLSLDGAPLGHGLDGAAIAIDPGEHTLRFERDGAAPVDQRVVVVEGEKGRVVTGRFAAPEGAAASSTPAADEAPRGGRKLTPLVVVLAGVGVVGLASFTGFGLKATGDLDQLRQTCAPYCSSSQLSTVKTEALVADLSLGVGIVALAGATYVFFTQDRTPKPAEAPVVTFDVRPERGGAFARVGVRF
jgi:hypothetical protein